MSSQSGTIKDDVRGLLETLPDDVTLGEIMHALYVKSRIMRGFRESEAGEGSTQEEMESLVRQWLE